MSDICQGERVNVIGCRRVCHGEERCYVVEERAHHETVSEDLIRCRHKLAEVFLPEPPITHLPPLFLEKCQRDPGALRCQDLNALPLDAAVLPSLEEVATLSERSRHEYEPAT